MITGVFTQDEIKDAQETFPKDSNCFSKQWAMFEEVPTQTACLESRPAGIDYLGETKSPLAVNMPLCTGRCWAPSYRPRRVLGFTRRAEEMTFEQHFK